MNKRDGSPSPSGKLVRYTKDPLESGRLRLALYEAWDGRCAWCRRPVQDHSYVEIDHILPQAKFPSARAAFGLPDTFELHGLSNLAPICAAGRRCNQEKSDSFDDQGGAISKMLKKAEERADGVAKAVQSMRLAVGVEKDLLHSLSAPLDEQPVQTAFRGYGRLLAQRLHAVDPALVEVYMTERIFDLNVEPSTTPGCLLDEDYDDIVLPLDEAGRAAYTVAKTLFGVNLDDVLTDGLEQLIKQLDDRVDVLGEGDDGYSHGGFNLTGRRSVSLDGLSSEVDKYGLIFVLRGSIDSEHSASVPRIDQNGETQYGQCDVSVDGDFIVTARFTLPYQDLEIEIDDDAVSVAEI